MDNRSYEKEIQLVTHGKRMTVSVQGDGETVLVFLPGLGSPSTTIEFRAMAHFLAGHCKMIFVDPLGYGRSERTEELRTVQNLVEELHEALAQLSLTRYLLVPHSLSGLMMLAYANRYPEEVAAVIGIDCCVPKQYEIRNTIERNLRGFEKRKKNKDKVFTQLLVRTLCRFTLRGCKDYAYSKEMIAQYAQLMQENLDSSAPIGGITTFGENALALMDKKIPPQIPVLFLLSTQAEKMIPAWSEWHTMLYNEGQGKTIVLKGNHMLQISATKRVCDEILSFLAQQRTADKQPLQ